MTRTADIVSRLGACDEAIKWAGTVESPQQAWETCPRGDWLLWLAARIGVRRQDVVLAACACARLALPYVPEGEDRPRISIETAERWTRGEATIDQVRSAARDAWDAYSAYYAAHYADYSADYSACFSACYSAYSACSAAYSARVAARVAAYAAHARAHAHDTALLRCADLVRSQIPWSAIEAALGEMP